MTTKNGLRHCPTCGSPRLSTVRGDYSTQVCGRPVTVADLERHECPDCGEVLFGPEAMRRLEAHWPVAVKHR